MNNKVDGYKGLEKPKTIDELLKGGFKKGEFVNLFSYTGKGTSYIDTTHLDIEKSK
jgi:hypothetical protein